MVAPAFVLVNVIKTLKQITKLNLRKQCDGGTLVRSRTCHKNAQTNHFSKFQQKNSMVAPAFVLVNVI